jgi:cardiolipin synthase
MSKRWLPRVRPFAGRRLRRELRAENVGRLAARLPAGVRDPGFEELLERINASPFLPGNHVSLYFGGTDAIEAMLGSIDAAREEVLLEVYIFRDDATGLAFRDALLRAAGRGATVRVLADAFGSLETDDSFWDSMRAAGIEVRIFHPLLAHFLDQPFRDHRKILVVDRRTGFTGGMNIGKEYGSSRRRAQSRVHTWRDTQARVEGPTAWDLAVVFAEGWARADGMPFLLPSLTPVGALGARVLSLATRQGRGVDEKAAVLTAAVAAARWRVWITNSYFAPRPRAIRVLTGAVRRGVDVRLLLPGSSDAPLVRHAGHGYFGELLRCGVRIFEYRPAVLHAKTLLVDDFVSVVGSTNLDYRSFQFNAEANLVILDDTTGTSLARAFEDDLSRSEEISLDDWGRRSLLHRLGDSLARCLAPVL